MVSQNLNKVPVDDKYKVIAAENVLYQKLVREMDTKNTILQENCSLLKEKIDLLQQNKNKEQRSAPSVMPSSRQPVQPPLRQCIPVLPAPAV
nr:unnamed protein product [Callosobruchus analis]